MRFSEYKKYIIPDLNEDETDFMPIDYSEIATWGLNKFLVPMKQMITQSLEIEGCQSYSPMFTFYGINKNGKVMKLDESSNKLYSAEYSFDIPVRPNYTEMNQTDLTDDIVKDWTSAIGNRVLPIIQNAISNDAVEKFDSNPNMGCFYHIYSGRIDYFPLTKINDFMIAECNLDILDKLQGYKNTKDETIASIKLGFIARKLLSPEYTRLIYYLFYQDDPVAMWELFETSLPVMVNGFWKNYMIEMMKRRAKVIVVP